MDPETQRSVGEIFGEGSLVDSALAQAARESLLLHKRLGLPIAVWRDGAVVWVPPEEIEIPNDAAAGEGSATHRRAGAAPEPHST